MPDTRDYTRPEYASAALVIIDTQNATLDAQPLEIPGTSAALPAMRKLAAAFRQTARPIVHVVRIYQTDGRNVDLCRRSAVECGGNLVLENTPDCQIAPGLLPEQAPPLDCAHLLAGGIQSVGPSEVIIYKPRWGAFYNTPLEAHLQALAVSTLVFAGSNFPNCPRASIYEASERDYRLIVVRDALSGLYDRGISELQNIGVRFLTVAELIEKMNRHFPGGTHEQTV
jgi:nicotinamidase-related amidase